MILKEEVYLGEKENKILPGERHHGQRQRCGICMLGDWSRIYRKGKEMGLGNRRKQHHQRPYGGCLQILTL